MEGARVDVNAVVAPEQPAEPEKGPEEQAVVDPPAGGGLFIQCFYGGRSVHQLRRHFIQGGSLDRFYIISLCCRIHHGQPRSLYGMLTVVPYSLVP